MVRLDETTVGHDFAKPRSEERRTLHFVFPDRAPQEAMSLSLPARKGNPHKVH